MIPPIRRLTLYHPIAPDSFCWCFVVIMWCVSVWNLLCYVMYVCNHLDSMVLCTTIIVTVTTLGDHTVYMYVLCMSSYIDSRHHV